MELTFFNPGVEYMIQRIMDFQTEDESAFWTEPLYHFYPQLDKVYASSLPFADRKGYIERIMKSVYADIESTINEKVTQYSLHWKNCKDQISDALSDAFEVTSSDLFNDLRCNVSMSPIEPRFLNKHSFDVFYLNSDKGAIGESIHEIIHFFWFYVWNRLFTDSYAEYERPSLKWILSEMVVESIMRDPRLFYEQYLEAQVSDDFAEIVKLYGERVTQAADEIMKETEKVTSEIGMNDEITAKDCSHVKKICE